MKKAVVFTLGCKVNSCESHSIMQGLGQRGFIVSDKLGFADLYIINTCAVTAEAEKKSRQAVARAKKFNPNCQIIITGCASQFEPESFLNKNNVTLVTGAKVKSRLLELIDNQTSGNLVFEDEKTFDDMPPFEQSRERHFIKVQDGCDNFCAYCIIPHLRGRETSRDIKSILAEINQTSALEVIITGINISAFQKSGGGLSGLIDSLTNVDKRIRLGSLEINVIDQKLLQAAKRLKNFAPHFHLSLQSGSDKVLRDMNRKYTAADYLQKIQLIRNNFPNAAITTDIICGFPTETHDDFMQTVEVVKKAEFSDIHCFSYSKRTGTKAAKLKDISPDIKKERLELLLDLAADLKKDYLNQNINSTLEVLFESQMDNKSVGYSQNYIRVYVEGRHSNIKNVTVKKLYKDGVLGEIK